MAVSKSKIEKHSHYRTDAARKGYKIAEVLKIPPEKFKASNGWLDRFKKRCGINAKVISGESGDVREETVDSWKERLPEILEGWAPQNIWNMDETGQFFRAFQTEHWTKDQRIAKVEKSQRRG